MVKLNAPSFKKVNSIYGGHIDTYKSDIPRSLGIAHILRTNPDLAVLPEGVMRVDITAAIDYDVPKKNLVKDVASIYVWCRQLNREAHFLYTNNSSLFVYPYPDLWKCAYLRTSLRPRSFDVLWSLVNPLANAYESLLNYTETITQSILDWPVRKLKKFVLYDCDFAVQLAQSQGPMVSSNTGREPVPPAEHYDVIFGEGR
jgi:hypothetical protein